jgi:hypothetical protein
MTFFTRKENPEVVEKEVIHPAEDGYIPAFFLCRIIGWFAVAAVIVGVTLFWSFSNPNGRNEVLSGAMLIALISVVNGLRTLRTAKKKDYFTLRLTCIDVRPLNLFESIPAYLNPASNTAFRSGQQIALQSETGLKIIFVYEKSRKFLVGGIYDFYFHKPAKDDRLTTELLERLRIDHAIVDTDISKDIQASTINK